MDWLGPAITFLAIASAILGATFIHVGLTSLRRRYMLLWGGAWFVAVPYLLLSLASVSAPPGRMLWTVHELLLVLNALLMVGGCHDFLHRQFPIRRLALLASPFIVWVLVAPAVTSRFLEVQLPGSLLLATAYLWTAWEFGQLWRERATRGARRVAILFLLAGLHELDYPLLGETSWGAPVGFSLQAALVIGIALGLLTMVLEEARDLAEGERARVRAVIDNLPVGVLLAAPDGRVLMANAAARELVGEPLDLANESWPSLERRIIRSASGDPCPAPDQPMTRTLRTGEPSVAREFLLVGGDGRIRPVIVNAATVSDAGGRPQGAVAVIQDVSEVKQLQLEVERADRLRGLGALAAGVAHDFNNALTVIIGHAELASVVSTEAAVRASLTTIRDAALDSMRVVRRIQDVARVRPSRGAERVDLVVIVREIVEFTRPRWREESIARGVVHDVSVSLPEDAWIDGHSAELRDALLNLVMNALDAMPKGGTLSLSVMQEGAEIALMVADSGEGMSEDVRRHVFEPFFTTKGPNGTGLGLALVGGIVQRHAGRIDVRSELGRGTTVTLRFPRASALVLAEPPAELPVVAPTVSRRVLIVDDEDAVRAVIRECLRADGHVVVEVPGGLEALAMLETQAFDVVFTDLGMPGMNGWELAALLADRWPRIPVVLVTGWGETVPTDEARSRNVSAVISKPFTRAAITACLATLVTRSGAS